MQQVTPSTAELPLIAALRGPDQVSEDILRTFGDSEKAATLFAIRWAWDHRRDKSLTQSSAAERIGIAASHFCNILSGRKYLPPHKINAYEWAVGNHAVSLTIARFAVVREQEQVRQLAAVIAEQLTKAA